MTPTRSPPWSSDGGNEKPKTILGVDDVHKLYKGVTCSSEDDHMYIIFWQKIFTPCFVLT